MEENVAYTDPNMVLPPSGQLYPKSEYVPAPDTRTWYAPKLGCQKGVDPTEISRRYTFPDQVLPRGIQLDLRPIRSSRFPPVVQIKAKSTLRASCDVWISL